MANEHRFTGLSGQYAKYRPSYPPACIDYILETAQVTGDGPVADVGAGTGIFSALLLQKGLRVFGVEPNDEMRQKAVQRFQHNPAYIPVAAPAERTGLAAGSLQLVCAAQAFHWFDPLRFAAECHRVLRPGGMAALVWNTRDLQDPVGQAYSRLRQRFKQSLGPQLVPPGTVVEETRTFFGGQPTVRLFQNPLIYDRDGFVGYALSASYAPKPGDAERDVYIAALNEFFDRYQTDGRLPMPYLTEVFIGPPDRIIA